MAEGRTFPKKVQVPSGPDTGQGELGKSQLGGNFPRELFLYILGVNLVGDPYENLDIRNFSLFRRGGEISINFDETSRKFLKKLPNLSVDRLRMQ